MLLPKNGSSELLIQYLNMVCNCFSLIVYLGSEFIDNDVLNNFFKLIIDNYSDIGNDFGEFIVDIYLEIL